MNTYSIEHKIIDNILGWVHGKRPYTFRGCPYWRVKSRLSSMVLNDDVAILLHK